MNGSKLMDALQYIDDDLLEQAQRMRDGRTGAGTAAARPGSRGRVILRRLPYIAALAAASLLAVFTLRFVSGKSMMGSSGAADAPKAESAAAVEEDMELEEALEETAETTVETAGAEPDAFMAAPAQAAPEEWEGGAAPAESTEEALYDSAEAIAQEVPAGEDTNAAASASMAMQADEEAAESIKEAPETAAAAASANELAAAKEAAAETAAASKEEALRAEITSGAGDAGEIQVDEVRTFIEAALSGRAVRLSDPAVYFDGSMYTVNADGTDYHYGYLLSETYTDEQGVSHQVYMLSAEDKMTESEVQTAVIQGISAEKGYILLAE